MGVPTYGAIILDESLESVSCFKSHILEQCLTIILKYISGLLQTILYVFMYLMLTLYLIIYF